MVTFLFWNLNRKPLLSLVTNLVLQHGVDILILTECLIPTESLLIELNHATGRRFHFSQNIGCKKVQIYCSFLPQFIEAKFETHRLTIRHVNLPGVNDILLVCIHFPSKLYWKESSQAIECTALANNIKNEEMKIGHRRTVLVGDLNMNPFEDGVVSASGLHGVMTRNIAGKGKRIVQGREHFFFYNPMWGFLGDRPSGPPGTYYYSSSEQTEFFWNVFDQVLIRPDVLPFFDNKDIMILDSDGTTPLISSEGLPDAKSASDHLPVLFKLKL